MKAVVMHQYGGPEVLSYEEFPEPAVQTGEVLVHVAAASVNPFDLKIRSGALKQSDLHFTSVRIALEFPGAEVGLKRVFSPRGAIGGDIKSPPVGIATQIPG